jgi:L-cystine transport system permease protein
VFQFENFVESLNSALIYLPKTLMLIIIPLILGTLLGGIIAFVRVYKVPVLDKLFSAFIVIYQGVPVVVAIMIYNLLFNLKFTDFVNFFHLSVSIRDIDFIWIGVFALTMMAITFISDIIRGALLSIDPLQNEAGYSVGLTKLQTIRRIVIPQLIPAALPGMVNAVIILIKSSSIVMTVGICEVMMGALIPSSRTYTYFEGYLAAALIYWALAIIVEAIAHPLSKRVNRFRKVIQ